MKICVSFISPEKARANLTNEIPGWDFDAVQTPGRNRMGKCTGANPS
jgi:putative alpha-1,2-mannosidase